MRDKMPQQAHRLSPAAASTAEIVHDLRNVLMRISTSVEAALAVLRDHPAASRLAVAKRSVHDAAALLDRLRDHDAEPPPTPSPYSGRQPLRRRRGGRDGSVLVAAADSLTVETLPFYLARGGYDVLVATNAQQAQELLGDGRSVALTLLDESLASRRPGEAERLLRKAQHRAPLVWLGRALGNLEVPAPDVVLDKPFSRATLLNTVGSFFDERARANALE